MASSKMHMDFLCYTIRNFWAAKGCEVDVYWEYVSKRVGNKTYTTAEICSDLVNGLPRGWQGEQA